jgi:hypothetical protein
MRAASNSPWSGYAGTISIEALSEWPDAFNFAVARRTWRDVGCLPRRVSAAGVMFCTTPDIAGHRRGMARARRPRADISSITAAPLQLAERGPGTGKPSLTQ